MFGSWKPPWSFKKPSPDRDAAPGELRPWTDRPAFHTYCYGLIQIFIDLILHAPTSVRAASGALVVFQAHLPDIYGRVPTPNGGHQWLLRLGLYELTRPLERADDWIWIVDHTIQLGTIRCLLVVGIRLSVWNQLDRPLRHQDLSVLALEPTEHSNSELVQSEFDTIVKRTGVPRAILSDGCRELKRAIEDFGDEHTGTANLYDVKHKAALLVKHELEKDSRWAAFCTKAGQARKQLQFDRLAFLLPPLFKLKARYMNLAEMIAWGKNVRRFLDDPVSPDAEPLNIGKLNITLGWLREYDEALEDWNALMQVVTCALSYLRVSGYHRRAVVELIPQLSPLARTEISRRVSRALLEFVNEESKKAQPAERLPASSECLESLIGRGKRLEGQQSKSGFTKMVLGMAAAVCNPTCDLIAEAFAAVKTRDVAQWARDKLGASLQARRRAAFRKLTAEQN